MIEYLRLLEETEDNGGLANILVKVGSLVVLLGIAVGFGIMPCRLDSCKTSNKCLGLSNAFSGGIFLGMGLFHILPESHELLVEASDLPIAFFCAFGSYAIILFVEKIAFDSHSLVHHAHDHGEECHHECGNEGKDEHKEEHSHENEKRKEENDKKQEENDQNPKTSEAINAVTVHVNEENAKEAQIEKEKKEGAGIQSSMSSYVLLLALGFHGFFEGMALGIQETVRGSIFLLIAIIAHKWAASLTLGISFFRAGVSQKQYIIMILIFAFITPVGIALGLILSSTANEIVEGVFLSISVGTFIYIACSEVIVDEFANPNNKCVKFLMFLLGALVTAGLSLLEMIDGMGHSHNHEHEHED